jgi:formate hydrogenlyase subunit 6/NADH:ubiquinone oxidoreductase subunit I
MLGIFKAMRVTLGHLPRRKITVQYPEQREHLPERSRGLFRVVIDPASGYGPTLSPDPTSSCSRRSSTTTARPHPA